MSLPITLGAPVFLAALAITVPIFITFLVRKRKRILRVPSTMLWRLGAKSVTKTRKIRDIRRLIALLACLGGVAALALAAARPGGKRATTTVYVVDVSSSMAGAPMDDARHFLMREVSALGPNGRVAIVTAGTEPRIALASSAPGPLVDKAIAALVAEKESASLEDALHLAEGLHAHVIVLSDHPLDKEASRGGWTEQRVFPRSNNLDNVGISSLYTHTAPDARDDEERDATIVVATSSTALRRARIRIIFAGRTLSDRAIEIPAQGEATENVTLRGAGKLVAKITSDDGKSDALDIDNEATLEETARRPPHVALIRKKSTDAASYFFVTRALEAAGVKDIDDVDIDEAVPTKAEVAVVLDDGNARPKNIPQFLIGVQPAEFGLEPRSLLKGDAHLRSISTEDPLLRGVALDELTSLHALVSKPPPGARSLVDLDGGPALIAGGSGNDAWVWLGIDPEASDLVLRVAFPVLVGNVMSHLGGASSVVSAKTVPRDEVALTKSEVSTALDDAAEPRWRMPTSPPALIALLGSLLLAFEVWFTFHRRSSRQGQEKKPA